MVVLNMNLADLIAIIKGSVDHRTLQKRFPEIKKLKL